MSTNAYHHINKFLPAFIIDRISCLPNSVRIAGIIFLHPRSHRIGRLIGYITASWIARGLEVALSALLITGMGGALANVIKAAPAINSLAGLIENSGVPGLLIPFLIGGIMFTAVGSMTTGGMTAAGVVGPMMGILGLTPVSTVLAIGAGTMIFNHVNNSGFWVISRFFNLDLKQGLKYITIPDLVAGVFCFILVALGDRKSVV